MPWFQSVDCCLSSSHIHPCLSASLPPSLADMPCTQNNTQRTLPHTWMETQLERHAPHTSYPTLATCRFAQPLPAKGRTKKASQERGGAQEGGNETGTKDRQTANS
mmetsp:Transcript_27079/g.77862  ORF Transcript_27079/g.77862 Transcript_27079/m.77862 type:complete len:106 (-) Transcript_27079:548-865(-)